MNPVVQRTFEGFACVAGAKGEADRAARLWGAAQSLHETKDIPRDIDFLAEADARIAAVRSGMGEEEWDEAWRKGRVMTLDEAVSYALEEEGQAPDLCPRLRTSENLPHASSGYYILLRVGAFPTDFVSTRRLCRRLPESVSGSLRTSDSRSYPRSGWAYARVETEPRRVLSSWYARPLVQNPSDWGCAMLRSTIHCHDTKIGIGRGLDLLHEVGCLRGSEPVAQPATRDGRLSGRLLC